MARHKKAIRVRGLRDTIYSAIDPAQFDYVKIAHNYLSSLRLWEQHDAVCGSC